MDRLTDDGINVRRPAKPQASPEPVLAEPDPEPTVDADPFVDEVASLSVDEVMDRVEAGEWDSAEVYVAEEDGKGRTTLLKALESFAASQ